MKLHHDRTFDLIQDQAKDLVQRLALYNITSLLKEVILFMQRCRMICVHKQKLQNLWL